MQGGLRPAQRQTGGLEATKSTVVYSDLWCGIILDGDISCITVASHICIASVSGPAAPTLLSFRRSSTTKGRQRPGLSGLSGLGLGSAWARPGQIGQARATDS